MKQHEDRALPGWMVTLVAGGAAVAIMIAERKWPLRRRRESQPRRMARNFGMAGMSAVTVEVLHIPVLDPVVRFAAEKSSGIVPRLGLGPAGSTIVSVLLLDWTLWIWHWLNHRNRFLWRFHKAHHIDRDLDASTAARFHFGEMGLSVLARALQVIAIGPSARAMSLWQTMLLVSIFFHHSNIDLGARLDRILSRILVTPRMHGIHHSDHQHETDSNWSSLFTLWDQIHRTFREDVRQDQIRIGVAAYQKPSDVTFQRSVLVPFDEVDGDWIGESGHSRVSRSGRPSTITSSGMRA